MPFHILHLLVDHSEVIVLFKFQVFYIFVVLVVPLHVFCPQVCFLLFDRSQMLHDSFWVFFDDLQNLAFHLGLHLDYFLFKVPYLEVGIQMRVIEVWVSNIRSFDTEIFLASCCSL